MKIPYGVSNFGLLRTEGYFYVDKTPFLPILEDLGPRSLVFLRPRRMGKSLFVSLLEHYYDLGHEGAFDTLFRGLFIHDHPTPQRHRYLVLTLDFSVVGVDGGGEGALARAFLEAVRSRVRALLMRHAARVPALAPFAAKLDGYDDAASLMANLLAYVRGAGHALYLIIDEYDNFANRLLGGGAERVNQDLVAQTGFVRTFYATLKTGTASGAISRMFITGVAPLLLDDLSSGFNIATHISNSRHFNELAGFTHGEVERAIDELIGSRRELAAALGDRRHLVDVLAQYYDGYRFAEGAGERVFNSDMVLYFLREVVDRGRFPAQMLDLNVRTDYRRLQHIGMLTGVERDERRALLETIVSDGHIESPIEQQFGVRTLNAQTQFISLLYYLGMLTLGEAPPGRPRALLGHRLEIPNRVIRELQWEHLAAMLQDEARVALDTRELEPALVAMAIDGDIAPFLDIFHTRVVEALGVKDLRRLDEKAIKLMMLAFLSLSRLFYPLSEKEMAQGYCDLFLGVSPLYPGAKFAWLLELKYLPAGAKAPQIEKAFAAAGEQVERYAGDARLVPLLTRGQSLRAGSLVFVGAKRALFRAWPPAPAPRKRAPKARAR